MDVEQFLKDVNPNLLIFLLTSLVAFISWIIKGSIENPINKSKATFEKTYNVRIEILTEIKNRLVLILYFKDNNEETTKFKEQLQELLLKDGKSAYLNKDTLDNVIRLSIDELYTEELIKNTITSIDQELYKIISKIEDEVSFYRKFSNLDPVRKIIGIILLALQNIIIILLIGGIICYTIYFFIGSETCGRIFVVIFAIFLMLFSNWYLSKK